MREEKKAILVWLIICAALVYTMIIIGGYTRLTHSGLSIVEWKPISGIIPPLTENSWLEEFDQYKLSPEFKIINSSMDLPSFKQIFWVEYIHRLLGRVTGLVFLLPFLYFYQRLSISQRRYFAVILLLMAVQGAIGWFMVKSGLSQQPNVSQYRLALHLVTACIILSLLVWQIVPGTVSSSKYAYFSFFLLLLQITSGAFVAGLNAGLVYNSFPLMDGDLIPTGLLLMKPSYLNLFENVTMVQFTHRLLGIINFINLLAYSFKIFNLEARKNALLLAGLITLQLFLGILTLLLQTPLFLALMHQAVAILLLITMVTLLKENKC
jgi:heme a synthase